MGVFRGSVRGRGGVDRGGAFALWWVSIRRLRRLLDHRVVVLDYRLREGELEGSDCRGDGGVELGGRQLVGIPRAAVGVDDVVVGGVGGWENQATLRCPRGSTMKAAASGPTADPALPPTWKSDCASPCCPPDAIRATRDDSG